MELREQILYKGSPGIWTLLEGTLPAGVGLDQETGELVGNPTEYGEFPCKFGFKNGCGAVEKEIMVVTCTTPEILSDEIVFDIEEL